MATQVTASYGELAVSFLVDQDDRPAHVALFSAPLRLSEDELTAALYLGMGGEDAATLNDRDAVREIVTDSVVNAGMVEVDSARHRSAGLQRGTVEYEMWQACRAAVGLAFAAALVPAQRRELVGVTR